MTCIIDLNVNRVNLTFKSKDLYTVASHISR